MRFSLKYLLVLPCLIFLVSGENSMPMSTSSDAALKAKVKKGALYPHLQVTKKQLISKSQRLNVESDLNGPTPTATFGSMAQDTPKQKSDHVRRTSSFFLKIKLNIYLTELHSGIKFRCDNIRAISAVRLNRFNAESIAYQMLTELQAILALCLACLAKVRGCGDSPSPSGIPGGNPGVPVQSLCSIIYKITCELKVCYQLLGKLCVAQPVIRRICQSCLRDISNCMSTILSSSQAHVPDMLPGVVKLYGGNPVPFFNIGFGFGFSGISSVLGF